MCCAPHMHARGVHHATHGGRLAAIGRSFVDCSIRPKNNAHDAHYDGERIKDFTNFSSNFSRAANKFCRSELLAGEYALAMDQAGTISIQHIIESFERNFMKRLQWPQYAKLTAHNIVVALNWGSGKEVKWRMPQCSGLNLPSTRSRPTLIHVEF